MKNTPIIILATIVLFSAACGDDNDATSSVGDDGSSIADAEVSGQDDGSSVADAADLEEVSSVELSGVLRDGAGVALEGFHINLCFNLCRTSPVGADGSYGLQDVEPLTHLLEIWPASTGPSAGLWLAPMFPLSLASREQRTLDLLWLAPDKRVDLPETAAEVEIADGFFVTIGRDTARASIFLADEFTELYGVRFPDATLPLIEDIEQPVAYWVLGPMDTKPVSEGFSVRFTNKWSLPDGTTLQVWHADLDDEGLGTWVLDGEVSVKGDVISGDAKLPKLGSILLSR